MCWSFQFSAHQIVGNGDDKWEEAQGKVTEKEGNVWLSLMITNSLHSLLWRTLTPADDEQREKHWKQASVYDEGITSLRQQGEDKSKADEIRPIFFNQHQPSVQFVALIEPFILERV